jgi:serine/threonine protein kinase
MVPGRGLGFAMHFRVDTKIYDRDSLPSLGQGTYGEAFDLGYDRAAKLYYQKPDEQQVRKLVKLFDIGASVTLDREVAQHCAMPLQPAVDTVDNAVAGFSMVCFQKWVKLSKLTYNLKVGGYWKHEGFQFTDETAVATIYDLFLVLSALARAHVAIGDISLANILIHPQSGKPGIIDLDSVQFDEWESDSLGTQGYVDPNLLDSDLNASSGYHFDSSTDVFALTVVAYYFLTGCNPYHLPVLPPVANQDVLFKKRLSNLRVLTRGQDCLRAHGLQLADGQLQSYLAQRLDSIRRIKGKSGSDGEILYKHFVDVFVEDLRENLLESLGDEDERNLEYRMLAHLRTKEVIKELKTKYGLTGQLPVMPKQRRPFVARDPRVFESFLACRGINLGNMVS